MSLRSWATRKVVLRVLKGESMRKAMTFMSGNNRIAAIILMALVAGSNMLGGPDMNSYLDPALQMIGFESIVGADGNTYGSTEIMTMLYSLFAVGLTLAKRTKKLPENPSVANPMVEASQE